MTPDSLCFFLSFPESEISEDRLPSVFVRVVSPVERGSGKTPKNLRLHCWLVLFYPRLAPLPFLLLPIARLSPDPLTFTPFLSFPGFRPTFPFFLSLGCECQLTHWSPELGQRVVPPFRRFHTATVVSRPRRPFPFLQASPLVSLLSPLSKKYHGYFISRFKLLVVQENKLTLVEEVVRRT